MTARNAAVNFAAGAGEILREEANLAEEELSYVESSREWRDQLLDPAGWDPVLERFAGTMRLAVALTDPEGRLLGKCHNPQPTWSLARGAKPDAGMGCPFCLAPPSYCSAIGDAVRTGKVVIVEDQAGLAHAAVPLTLGGQQLGALIAGQVFSHYPQPLPLQRVARDLGISTQLLWQQATQQVPVARATLELYAELLMSLGQAFLGQRYAAILQRTIAETGRRYRLFFDGVKDYALLTLDLAGRITSWNSGAERLFGYREAEIIGQEYSRLFAPESFHWDKVLQTMLADGELNWVEREGWRVRKDGTRFLAAGVLASIGNGKVREYGSMVRDVTALRRSERDLQQAQKMEDLGVLAGGIAHDFNNLLTGITGSLSFVKTTIPADDPSYPMIEIAEQSSARASELVAQLLAYAGKGKFVITRFDFSALILEMLSLIAASIPKSVDVCPLLVAGLPWIEADSSQIRQVVMNLIINAAEAIGPAGGTVRVSTGVSDSGTDVFMEVKDSGAGMSESTKSKMFDPFFTTKFTGRGLGLAAVSGIVRDHKGKMSVESTPGQGTTFRVSFPAVQADDVVRRMDPPPLMTPSATATILVVDDEPLLRKLATAILENSGYSVLSAKDGREGVEVLRQNAPKIGAVLLDMTMPVMGGREAFQLIREIQPDVPIIVSSGYGEVFAREELADDEITRFIQKPYTAARLVESIREAMQSSARRQASGAGNG